MPILTPLEEREVYWEQISEKMTDAFTSKQDPWERDTCVYVY